MFRLTKLSEQSTQLVSCAVHVCCGALRRSKEAFEVQFVLDIQPDLAMKTSKFTFNTI